MLEVAKNIKAIDFQRYNSLVSSQFITVNGTMKKLLEIRGNVSV